MKGVKRMIININHDYSNNEELKEIVKLVSQLEKEYSCNCTLNARKLNYIEFSSNDPKDNR